MTASTYSPSLRIELIPNGEQSGTWGTTTNLNLGTLIEDGITGYVDVIAAAISPGVLKYPLTTNNGAVDEARNAIVSLAVDGTISAAYEVYIPPVPKTYIMRNTAAYSVTIYVSTVDGNVTPKGTGLTIPAGKTIQIWTDGTDLFSSTDYVVGNLEVSGALAVTGNTAVTGNIAVTGTTTLGTDLILNGSSGTAGQVVVSQGTGAYPVWGNAFVAGMIMMWSGTIATIPSGWLLCNGSNGTPDLRNTFIIGAHSDDAGVAKTTITGSPTQTGGSKDAIVVSHTHTATVTDPGHVHNMNIRTTGAAGGGGGYDITNTGNTVSGRIISNTTGVTVSNSTTGSSGTDANLVPYYALAFIMKA